MLTCACSVRNDSSSIRMSGKSPNHALKAAPIPKGQILEPLPSPTKPFRTPRLEAAAVPHHGSTRATSQQSKPSIFDRSPAPPKKAGLHGQQPYPLYETLLKREPSQAMGARAFASQGNLRRQALIHARDYAVFCCSLSTTSRSAPRTSFSSLRASSRRTT